MPSTRSRKDLPAGIDAVLTDSVAAVSVGVVDGEERLDLEYVEDRDAEVDVNLVMTGSGKFIEVQGSGEEATFTRKQLDRLIELGEHGIKASPPNRRRRSAAGGRFEDSLRNMVLAAQRATASASRLMAWHRPLSNRRR